MEIRVAAIEYIFRALPLKYIRLLLTPDDIDEIDTVSDADAIEHLAEIRGRCSMHNGLMALPAHGFDHAQRGKGIDESRCCLARCHIIWNAQAHVRGNHAITGVHRAGQSSDGFAEQMFRAFSGAYNASRTFIADRHGFPDP